jgi:histidinol-phosphate phosphatase family protein
MRQPFVIFDRDGTLIESVPYLNDEKQLVFKPDIIESLLLLTRNNYKIGIITNQSGIARGYFDMFKVERIHKKILKYLRSSKIEIAFIFTCPHHPDEKCKCRKPNTELGELAIQKFNIDLKNSYMIGDQESDLQFGLALGLTVIQLKGSAIKSPFADHYSDTLMDAAMWITKR